MSCSECERLHGICGECGLKLRLEEKEQQLKAADEKRTKAILQATTLIQAADALAKVWRENTYHMKDDIARLEIDKAAEAYEKLRSSIRGGE